MEYLELDPLQDGKSRLQLIDSMGDDLSIVNDARASFEKESRSMSDKDIRLINYLVKHKHWSPFRSVVFKFKVKAPLYVCRQWWRHSIASNHNDEQMGWNEKSYRYTSVVDHDEFYCPIEFRGQSSTNHQQSEGKLSVLEAETARKIYLAQCEQSYVAYKHLLNLGVSREQARGILVPSVYTSWVWTVSLQALLNFIELRKGEGAQSEIGVYADSIIILIKSIVPYAIEAWKGNY